MRLVEDGPGAPMWVDSELDARLEAQQLLTGRQVYLGAATGGVISLHRGDVVLDVGANVGSFARLAAGLVGRSGRVLALEPLPQVFEALRRNAAMWATAAAGADIDAAVIEPVHAGVVSMANAASGSAHFTYFPKCAALSTLLATRDDADALQATTSIVRNDPAPAVTTLQRAARRLARFAPWLYGFVHTAIFRLLYLRGAQTVRCPVLSLNEVIDRHNVRQVSLLKINVERGELGVLLSLDRAHWLQVDQVSMQLHDRGEALSEAERVLRETAGFACVRSFKEPRFRDCCLVQVVASRKAT
ncbi:S-adenosyl-L-methionine-dependent methyltransferase [Haematococcus lacustris]